MESSPRAERIIEPLKEHPDVTLLRNCERLAARWGGSDFSQGLTDGVELARTTREFHDDSSTSITFTANHVRLPLKEGALFDIKNFFTLYVLAVEVSREITALPSHIHNAAVELHGEDVVKGADIYTESHRIFCTMSGEDGYFQQNLDVGYTMDDHEIDFSGVDICGGSNDDEDEDYGGDSNYCDSVDDETDFSEVKYSPFPGKDEFWDDDADLSDEARLLNDAWELIAEGSRSLNYDNTPFDIGILKNMKRIDTKLERREVKMTRLWAIAMLEIRNQQMQNCSNILELFNPKKSL